MIGKERVTLVYSLGDRPRADLRGASSHRDVGRPEVNHGPRVDAKIRYANLARPPLDRPFDLAIRDLMSSSHHAHFILFITALISLTAACGRSEDDHDRADMPSASGDAMPADAADMAAPRQDMREDLSEPDMRVDGAPDMKEDEPSPLGDFGSLGWPVARSQVDDRLMTAELYGDQGPVLFLLSAIHGNERLAVSHGERVRWLLQGGLAERLGMRIFLIQAGNPDGILYSTRENGNGIDLNRNFPAANFDPSAGGGDTPLSESESKLLAKALDWTEPVGVISVHCCVPVLDYDGPGEELALAMSGAMEPLADFPVFRLGSKQGSMGSYVGLTLALPIITFEFARAGEYDPVDQLDAAELAIEEGAFWAASLSTAPMPDVAANVEPLTSSSYRMQSIGKSAAQIDIRMDRFGRAADHFLLLSGLDASGRLGEHVAEYLRRELIAMFYEEDHQMSARIITLANPDGVMTRSTRDADGVDLLEDLTSAEPMSANASALRELLADPNLHTVYIVEDTPQDLVSLHGPDVAALELEFERSVGTITLADDAPEAYRPLITSLADAGKDVIFIGVGTQRLEAQGESDMPYGSPQDFWPLIQLSR